MGLPFQRFHKNTECAYYLISDADDDDETDRARRSRKTLGKPGRREASTQSAYVDASTQTIPSVCPQSPYSVPTYSASRCSISSISSSMNTSSCSHTFEFKASRTFNTRVDGAIDIRPKTHTRTPSAIEMQPLSPSRRYPPGVVVIRTFDEDGGEILEETDLTHRGSRNIDLKPTVVTSEVQFGMVQKTARTGLMERALNKVVDALGRDHDRDGREEDIERRYEEER